VSTNSVRAKLSNKITDMCLEKKRFFFLDIYRSQTDYIDYWQLSVKLTTDESNISNALKESTKL
jgi:hypothetical protein